MPGEYDGPERRRFDIERRLTKLEVTQQFILEQGQKTREEMAIGLQKLAMTLESMRDQIREDTADQNKTLAAQNETLAENTADIHWLKAWLWKTAGATAFISSMLAWLLKHL